MGLIEHTVDKRAWREETSSNRMLKLEQINEKLVHATWSLYTLGTQHFCITRRCAIISQTLRATSLLGLDPRV